MLKRTIIEIESVDVNSSSHEDLYKKAEATQLFKNHVASRPISEEIGGIKVFIYLIICYIYQNFSQIKLKSIKGFSSKKCALPYPYYTLLMLYILKIFCLNGKLTKQIGVNPRTNSAEDLSFKMPNYSIHQVSL